MFESMLLCLLHLGALSCLALAQDKHWRTLRQSAAPVGYLQLLGWSGLALALIGLAAFHDIGFGVLLWVLLLPLNGFVVVFALAWLRNRSGAAGPSRELRRQGPI